MTIRDESFEEFRNKVMPARSKLFFAERYFSRPISIRMTRLVLRVFPSITPNQASAAAFIVGLYGSLILGLATSFFEAIIGVLILLLWALLDQVDGEIARYKGMTSEAGHFLDSALDPIVMTFEILGLSCFMVRLSSDPFFLFVGVTIVVSYWFHRNSGASFMRAFYKMDVQGVDSKNLEALLTVSGSDKAQERSRRTVRIDKTLIFGLNLVLITLAMLTFDYILGWTLTVSFLGIQTTLYFTSLVFILYCMLVPYSVVHLIASFTILKKLEDNSGSQDNKQVDTN